jgi:hypothetical protein
VFQTVPSRDVAFRQLLTSSPTTNRTASIEEPQIFRFESTIEKEYNTIPYGNERKRDCDANKSQEDTKGKLTKKYQVFEMVEFRLVFRLIQYYYCVL